MKESHGESIPTCCYIARRTGRWPHVLTNTHDCPTRPPSRSSRVWRNYERDRVTAEERHDVEIAEYIALWHATLVGIEKRAFERQGATRDLIRSIRKLLEGRHAVTIEPVEADADKLSRAMIIPGRAKAGLISVDRSAPWWHDLSIEMSRFPRSAHDDRIDALAHLVRLAVERLERVRALMTVMGEAVPIEISLNLRPAQVDPSIAYRSRTPREVDAQRNAAINALLESGGESRRGMSSGEETRAYLMDQALSEDDD